MENELMNQESIIALLKNEGSEPITEEDTSRLMISEKVIRCEDGESNLSPSPLGVVLLCRFHQRAGNLTLPHSSQMQIEKYDQSGNWGPLNI